MMIFTLSKKNGVLKVTKLAPIVLFTYNRLWHTQQTIEALQKNELASESELFIYSDGGKDEESWARAKELREYLKSIDGFKNITIIEQEKNLGLADSIISGVTKIVNEYAKIIVLEDDIVTSPYFLRYMNDALDFYENVDKVWHISGWNYPIDANGLSDTFLWRNMNCWGWATWASRWKRYEKKPKELIASFNEGEIEYFNLDGCVDFWSQVIKNHNGSMNSWAIFWAATIHKSDGLCLNPSQTYAKNIGFDGTGVHTGVRTNYASPFNRKKSIIFEEVMLESKLALHKIKQFYIKSNNNSLDFSKNLNKIKNLLHLLDANKRYIIYGAGSGANLVLSFTHFLAIDYIVDANAHNVSNTLYGFDIKELSFLNTKYENQYILISVFGRASEIKATLIEQYSIPKEKIVSLDIL